jgi:hypothetical protein
MNSILSSHLIDSVALRADVFETFFAHREEALLGRIAEAMGKAIARDAVEPPGADPTDYEQEGEDSAALARHGKAAGIEPRLLEKLSHRHAEVGEDRRRERIVAGQGGDQVELRLAAAVDGDGLGAPVDEPVL